MKNGWQAKSIGEILQLEYGKPLDDADRKPSGRFPAYGANGVKDRTDKFYHDKPSIIVGRKGSAGEINLTEPKFWPLDVTYFVTFDDQQHELRFLYYLLTTLELTKLAKGVKPGINRNEVYSQRIRIPPPGEQRRIVGILDEAFAGIATAKANTEKNLQNAHALFESHLNAVFTKRSKGWVEKRLGDIVGRLTNGYVGPTRNIYLDSGIPYLLARHVKDNRLTFDEKTFVSSQFNQKNKKSMLKAGDVLLVQSGHIGHSAVVSKEHEGHNCHAMIVITPLKDVVTGPFLSLYFNSSLMRQKFEEIRSGSTVPHLTCKAVKELMIPIPDLSTQDRLMKHSRELQAKTQYLETIYRQKLAALDELKKSLLHQAFSGEL